MPTSKLTGNCAEAPPFRPSEKKRILVDSSESEPLISLYMGLGQLAGTAFPVPLHLRSIWEVERDTFQQELRWVMKIAGWFQRQSTSKAH